MTSYDKALERARKLKSDYQKELDKVDKNTQIAGQLRDGISALEMVFPELRESEDERIKKQLIDAIKIGRSNSGISFTEEAASRYIAWIEKHSEEEIKKIRKEEYTNGFNDAAGFGKQKEPHYTKRNALFDKCVENCDPEVMEEVSDKVDEMLGKEQKPVEWNKKPCLTCQDYKKGFEAGRLEGVTAGYNKAVNEMEQKPAGVWKPSEEQMSMLLAVLNDPNNAGAESCQMALKSLYNQLKKLGVKEEPEYYQHFDPDC